MTLSPALLPTPNSPTNVAARCVCSANECFEAMAVQRRAPGPHDVVIDIAYCGICHTDIHYARDEFARTSYPLVPGHEIAGHVTAVGDAVTKFALGDRAGIGVMVDSCRNCEACHAGLEQYCSGRRVMTYNGIDRDGTHTFGGYSQRIVADENYIVRLPHGIRMENLAPMLCAGITMYSPLRRWNTGPGKHVAILGLGGLGHLGVQIAKAMGAHVTVLDVAEEKRADAFRLGADSFHLGTDPATFSELANSIDLLISTVPAEIDLNAHLGLLRLNGTLVNTGVPERPLSITATSLLNNRRSISGTRSGSIAETQEMIDFCAEHGIRAEVEVINADRIDEAFERIIKGDVRYRFVIDIATLAD